MDKCRLCLRSQKRLHSLNTIKDGIKYCDMVHAISSNIKIDAETDEKLCITCCRKLEGAYNFKIMIENCDAELRNLSNTKRITFSTIEDIKVKIEIPDDDTKILNHDIIEKLTSHDDELEFKYNETLLKRKSEKQLTVTEFINSFQDESDNNNSCDEGYEVDIEYEPHDDNSDVDYVPGKTNLNQKKSSKSVTKNINKANKENKNKIIIDKPLKPKLIRNIRLKADVGKRNIVRKVKREPERQRNVCPYCGILFVDLKNHILIHSGEKKYNCDICKKAYFTPISLKAHHIKTHLPKNLRCDQCIAVFASKSDLLNHKKYSHTDVKNFKCDICSKAFKKKHQLGRHKAHLHNIGIKEFKCDQCEKICKSSDLLKHHLRVHTGERPYKCEMCSQPYSYKHDFNRHCFKKHGVLFKRRSVYVMNEEVLLKERALMRDLMLRLNGVIKEDVPLNPFEGPQAVQAYNLISKALAARQIPLDFEF